MKTHLDLFSGIGGFALAAQWNGYTTVGFCEIEPYAQKVLIKKFGAVLADANGKHGRRPKQPHASTGNGSRQESGEAASGGSPKIHSDIFTLNGADYAGVNLLTGGFPCQPFSFAGKRAGAADYRALWPEMRRVIGEAGPSWVLAENVPGIISMELDNVLSDLENIGYACWPIVVPACAVDARHRRDRVWIVAHANGTREPQQGRLIAEQRQRAFDSSKALANDDSIRGRAPGQNKIKAGSAETPWCGGEKVANPNCYDAQGKLSKVDASEEWGPPNKRQVGLCGRTGCWPVEPQLGRVAHGIPNRSHRLKGLGNAIVPQVAAQIISWMTP